MRRVAGLILTITGLAVAPAATARGQAPDRVEEDWRLVVSTPDITGVGPQITTSMSPVADSTTAPIVAFDLNYREYPSFVAGGYQAQVWSGDRLAQYSTGGKTAQFATANETVTWTQRLSLSNGQVNYTIASGQSTTWGHFGRSVQVSFASTLASLSGYSPSTSVANSGASWQVNNVQELTLVAVRYYAGGVLLSTDSTARPVVSNGATVARASTRGAYAEARPLQMATTQRLESMPSALASRARRRTISTIAA